MSPFRREHVYVSVEPDRVALVRLRADGHARDETIVPIEFEWGQPAASLAPVAKVLAQAAWDGAARSVVLSDQLVRYVVSPRPAGVRSAAELKRICEARFHQGLDHPNGDWVIAIDPRPFARHDVACGIEGALVEALISIFSVGGEVKSLRPFLVCEMRRLARRLPQQCWFAAVSRHCVALAGVDGGECRLIRMLTMERASAASLTETIARESLLSGEVDGDAPIFASGVLTDESEASAVRRLDASTWRSRPTTWCSEFRIALADCWT